MGCLVFQLLEDLAVGLGGTVDLKDTPFQNPHAKKQGFGSVPQGPL